MSVSLFKMATIVGGLSGIGTLGAWIGGAFSRPVQAMTLKMTNSGSTPETTRTSVSSITFINSTTAPGSDKVVKTFKEIKKLEPSTNSTRTAIECAVSWELEYFVRNKQLFQGKPLNLHCNGWGSAAPVPKVAKTESTGTTNGSQTSGGSTSSNK